MNAPEGIVKSTVRVGVPRFILGQQIKRILSLDESYPLIFLFKEWFVVIICGEVFCLQVCAGTMFVPMTSEARGRGCEIPWNWS